MLTIKKASSFGTEEQAREFASGYPNGIFNVFRSLYHGLWFAQEIEQYQVADEVQSQTKISGLEHRVSSEEKLTPEQRRNILPAKSTLVVRRTPHMDVIGEPPFRPGNVFDVNVFLDFLPARPGETSENFVAEVLVTMKYLDVEVWIAGTSHFAFIGDRVKILRIEIDAAKAQLKDPFKVRVRSVGEGEPEARLWAYFTYEGRPSGQVSVAVSISSAEPKEDAYPAFTKTNSSAIPEAAVFVLDTLARRPDLTIEITDPSKNRLALHYRVLSPHVQGDEFSQPDVWHLPEETGSLVAALLGEFVKTEAGLDLDMAAQGRLLSLRGAGLELWKLIPDPVKELFWKLLDAKKLRTIFVNSEEPYIPWELMIPTRHKDGAIEQRQPLGAEFAIGRWIPSNHTSPPQRIPLMRSLVIAPAYKGPKPKPLVHAAAEAEYVKSKIPGTSLTPVNLASVAKGLFDEVDLIHFVCHGAQGKSFGIQSIFLEAGELTSVQVNGMSDPKKKLYGRLVFMNACEVGRLEPALTGVGGFAKAFIELGAVGVIAPLWSVKDTIAHDVARNFYDNIGLKPIASILSEIRSKTYGESAGEDTYAAYCFYGDPAAW